MSLTHTDTEIYTATVGGLKLELRCLRYVETPEARRAAQREQYREAITRMAKGAPSAALEAIGGPAGFHKLMGPILDAALTVESDRLHQRRTCSWEIIIGGAGPILLTDAQFQKLFFMWQGMMHERGAISEYAPPEFLSAGRLVRHIDDEYDDDEDAPE